MASIRQGYWYEHTSFEKELMPMVASSHGTCYAPQTAFAQKGMKWLLSYRHGHEENGRKCNILMHTKKIVK